MVAAKAASTAIKNPAATVGVVLVGGLLLMMLGTKLGELIPDLAGDAADKLKDGLGFVGGQAKDAAIFVGDQVNIVPESKEFITALFKGAETQTFDLDPVAVIPEGAVVFYSQYGEAEYYQIAPTQAEQLGSKTRDQFITLYDEPLLDLYGTTIIPSVEGSFDYATQESLLNDSIGVAVTGVKKVFSWVF